MTRLRLLRETEQHNTTQVSTAILKLLQVGLESTTLHSKQVLYQACTHNISHGSIRIAMGYSIIKVFLVFTILRLSHYGRMQAQPLRGN